jgi:hypothetical protein
VGQLDMDGGARELLEGIKEMMKVKQKGRKK